LLALPIAASPYPAPVHAA